MTQHGRFGIVKGANKWRVIERVQTTHLGAGKSVQNFVYATDPLPTQSEAIAAYRRLTERTAEALVNPLDED